jgi:MmyB-like transcription regulator ligand binding domain
VFLRKDDGVLEPWQHANSIAFWHLPSWARCSATGAICAARANWSCQETRECRNATFAPLYSEAPWNAADMQGVTRALERMLRQHEPFPAVVMDRYWNVLMTNKVAPIFFNRFIDMKKRTGPRNMLHLMFDPDGMRPHIADWDHVAPTLIHRISQESVGHFTDSKTQELITELLSYPGINADRKTPKAVSMTPSLPVIPLGFNYKGATLRYFSMVTTVGTPQTVAAQELRIESLFPVDESAEELHHELMAGGSA